MERTYAALGLPTFAETQPALDRYVEGIRGYRKNAFPELPVALRRRIADAWRPCFEEWGYPSDPGAQPQAAALATPQAGLAAR